VDGFIIRNTALGGNGKEICTSCWSEPTDFYSILCFDLVMFFFFSFSEQLVPGMLASLAVVEGSYLSLSRRQDLVVFHKLSNYVHDQCLSPVRTHHGLAAISQITHPSLRWHISSEIEWNGNSFPNYFKIGWNMDDTHGDVAGKSISLIVQDVVHSMLPWIRVHIYGYGVDEDTNHFATDERYQNGELWRLPDVKPKWSTVSKDVGEIRCGAPTVVANIFMAATAVVTALAAVAGALPKGYSPFWLVVQALFAVTALVIAVKVDFFILGLHFACADDSYGFGAARIWPML
jgi:hypothetical protein